MVLLERVRSLRFEQQLYRMSTAGGAMEKLTAKAGRHNAVVSPNGQLVAMSIVRDSSADFCFLLRNRQAPNVAAHSVAEPRVAVVSVIVPRS